MRYQIFFTYLWPSRIQTVHAGGTFPIGKYPEAVINSAEGPHGKIMVQEINAGPFTLLL